MSKKDFTTILHRVRDYATGMGLIIIDSNELDAYFKGDLDGTRIWIDFNNNDEEELFYVLHMIGHAIQWGVDESLKELGSKLHVNPDDDTLKKLQHYEWEANCYGLYILHSLGIYNLDEWLYNKYLEDVYFLTHFYKTQEKVKEVTNIAKKYADTKLLISKEIPKTFIPSLIEGSRNGIVIDFKN